MSAAEVPTGMAHVCTTVAEVEEALDALGAPHVVKDDGLAAGKGVVVTDDRAEALEHARACLAKPDGAVVIEEYLVRPRGVAVLPLRRHHRGAADARPRTSSGSATATPAPTPGAWAPTARSTGRPRGWSTTSCARVAQPVVDEMHRRGTPFAGVLYVGLALTPRGPRVIEFNARFGDPETQVVLARLLTPLGGVLLAAARGRLHEAPPLRWSDEHAVTVVVAADNYPGTPRTGDPIIGLEDLPGAPDGLRAARRHGPRRRRRRWCPPAAGCCRSSRPGRRLARGARAGLRGGRRHRPARLAPPHRHRAARRARRGHRLTPHLRS